jgi:hypothetical protein
MSDFPTPAGGEPIFRTADRTIVGFGPPPRAPRPPRQSRFGGRRPLDLLIVAVAIAVVVVVVVMVLARGGGNKAKVSLSGTSSTTGSTLAFLPGIPGGSLAPDSTTVPATSSTAPTSTTTSTSIAATTTTLTTTTATTTATTIAAVIDCPASALQTQTDTDQRSYSTGQTVTITVTVHNASARTCLVQHPFPVGTKSPIGVISGGKAVWAEPPGSTGVIDSPKALNSGGSYLWATAGWNQKDNSGVQVPQGIYQAAANAPPGGGTPQITFTIGP